MRQLDEKLRENLVGLTSTEFTVRLQDTKGFRHMLKGDFGGQVLRQYVQASPGCIELLEAWKIGVVGKLMGNFSDWKSDSNSDDHCNYIAVTCYRNTKSVVGLDLENLNITGT
jgi:hypothetical protein